jgi:Holliday junction resolvasome RuvABC ATP-dependent DNA helicase subunit
MQTPIGQKTVLNKISDFSLLQNQSGFSPHIAFIARKGMGKTHIARHYAQMLVDSLGNRRKITELNCASLKGIDFVNDFLVPYVHDSEITVIFDEAGELPNSVTAILLTVCEKNKERKARLTGVDDETFEFDFSRFTFLFCTNEPNKVNEALLSRLNRIELQEYDKEELASIFMISFNAICEGITIDKQAKSLIVDCMRQSPREAINLCEQISPYCYVRDIDHIDVNTWEDLCLEYGIFPHGLNATELEILKLLYRRGSMQLQEISACLKMNKTIVQKEYETYLRDLEFMHISGKRRLTGKGMNYLKDNNFV